MFFFSFYSLNKNKYTFSQILLWCFLNIFTLQNKFLCLFEFKESTKYEKNILDIQSMLI